MGNHTLRRFKKCLLLFIFQVRVPSEARSEFQMLEYQVPGRDSTISNANDMSRNKSRSSFESHSPTSVVGGLFHETNPFGSAIRVGIMDSNSTVTYFHMESLEPACTSPCPLHNPPPPKLHYSTFWKSVTKKVYKQKMQESRQMARSCSLLHTRMVD